MSKRKFQEAAEKFNLFSIKSENISTVEILKKLQSHGYHIIDGKPLSPEVLESVEETKRFMETGREENVFKVFQTFDEHPASQPLDAYH